jgi:NADH-quinone oxidoreductase subunit A
VGRDYTTKVFFRAAMRGARRGFGPGAPTVSWMRLMDAMLLEYLPILIFLGIAGLVSTVFIGGAWFAARQKPDREKNAAYECGFDAFSDARTRFEVRYYLVAILFIIFDLEVAFLFPWAVSLGKIGLYGFWSMVVFLGVLTIGFVYEWRRGALEWE